MDQIVRERAKRAVAEQRVTERMQQVLVIVDPEPDETGKVQVQIRTSDNIRGEGDEIMGILLRAVRALYREDAPKSPKERAERAGLIVP